MTTYIVKSDFDFSSIKTKYNNAAAAAQALQDKQKELRKTVEAFAATNRGKVTIISDAWVVSSFAIDTTPALAKKLSTLKGISDVSKPGLIDFGNLPF